VALELNTSAEQAAEVVAVVVERFGSAFSDRLERCEMNHGRDRMALEQRGHGGGVAHIGPFECDRASAEALQTIQHFGRTVGKIIDPHDIEPSSPQRQPRV
jgi:hypothetical protein